MRNFNLKEFLKKSAQEFQKPEKKKEIFHQSKGIEVDKPLKKITKPSKEVDTFELEGELGDEQKKLFELMERSDHNAMFITGKAGTGKSYLLDYFVKHTKKEVAVVAPTGVAALNVGGQTIHSFFVLPAHVLNPNEPLEMSSKVRNILKALKTLIIDEVSMVSSDLMRAINRSMQEANNNEKPFGGKQVIMFGDLYQLPPVAKGVIRKFLKDHYGSIFFFGAWVFSKKEIPLKIYELSHIYRQKDPEFIKILNGIRVGNFEEDDLKILNRHHKEGSIPNIGVLTLFNTNKEVNDLNNRKLNEIPEKEYIYKAKLTGYFKHKAEEGKLKDSDIPTGVEIKLKVGAQVMLVRNDTPGPDDDPYTWKPRWVNGTLGIVTALGDDYIVVSIDGHSYSIPQSRWEEIGYNYDEKTKHLYREVTGSFTQYPVKLAWAVTIHKSQGQTYQSVAVDFGKGTFAEGQAYVALSRCVDINTLYLHRPVRKDDIKVNKEVLEFMSKAEKIDYNN